MGLLIESCLLELTGGKLFHISLLQFLTYSSLIIKIHFLKRIHCLFLVQVTVIHIVSTLLCLDERVFPDQEETMNVVIIIT